MIRSALIFATIFAIVGLADHYPMDEFPEGTYLGEGRHGNTNGDDGTYASYAVISSNQWELFYARDGQRFQYNIDFDFTDEGFFSALAIEYTNDGQEKIHVGNGDCGSMSCHFTFNVGDRVLEETITFAAEQNRIFRRGSMSVTDPNGAVRATHWEETMIKIPDDFNDEDGLPGDRNDPN
jgi:hypothetical protein